MMTTRKQLALTGIAILMTLSLGACGKEEEAAAPPVPTELEGKWIYGSCSSGSKTFKNTIEFSFSNFTFTSFIYGNPSCSGNREATVVRKGTIVIGEEIPTPESAKKIVFTQTSYTLTPATGAAATYNALCPGLTFTDGVETDITGATCDIAAAGAKPIAANGASIYSIFLRDAFVNPKTLKVGRTANDEFGSATEGSRPTDLTSLPAPFTYTKD